MNQNIFDNLIILLLLVVVVLVVFRRIKLPPVLGYLFVGSLVGPNALALIPNPTTINHLAFFGVMFLMFTVGLDFSYIRMFGMRNLVFGLGGAQVVLSTAITSIAGILIGMSPHEAVIVGCIVAMSSTAIVLKQLSDQLELNTTHGDHAIAILLFQDLAAIPFFVLISSFANPTESVWYFLLGVVIKSIIAILAIIIIGRWIVRPLFREVVGTHSLELFTLTGLLITLSSAWITNKIGLSLSLGAFLAGMILSETEYRHQLEAVIRPFRDVLIGLFFVTVGMLFNVFMIPLIWKWMLLLLIALLFLKTALIAFLSYLTKKDLREALATGMLLAQGGEFGFALLTLALSQHLLPPLYGQVVLGGLLFSMALAPLIIRFHGKIEKLFLPEYMITQKRKKSKFKLPEITLRNHVILCGFGRVGQSIGRILEREKIEYIAIEFDLELVHKGQLSSYPVIYGDASLYEILLACQVKNCKALVITFEQMSAILKILQQVRIHDKKLPIFVRTDDDSELEKLQSYGATEVIPSALETSLMLASHILAMLQVPAQRIWQQINQIRKSRYQLFHEIIADQEEYELYLGDFQKRFFTLTEGAYAINKTIKELALNEKGVVLIAVNRDDIDYFHFPPNSKLQESDILRLYGPESRLDKVENYITDGIYE